MNILVYNGRRILVHRKKKRTNILQLFIREVSTLSCPFRTRLGEIPTRSHDLCALGKHIVAVDFAVELPRQVLSRVMRKYNSVTYEVGKAKAEQAAGMFGLAAGQWADSCPSRVAKPLAKPLTGGWRSAAYARSQSSAPCFSRSICSSDFMLM